MSERQYNSEETAAIFDLASKTERTALPAPADGAGMTLSALQDIGREVGISPESIAFAARQIALAGQPSVRQFIGLPIGVGRTVEFDQPLTDAAWEGLVADLRTTFNARGSVRYDGPFRQWTNGNLQALLEPTAHGHRLRLQTLNGSLRARMGGGILVLVIGAATLIAETTTLGLSRPSSMAGMAALALLGIGMFASGAMNVAGWARRRSIQFE